MLFSFSSKRFLSSNRVWELQCLRHIVNWVKELFFTLNRFFVFDAHRRLRQENSIIFCSSIQLRWYFFKVNLKVHSYSTSISNIQDGTENGSRQREKISFQKVKYFFYFNALTLAGENRRAWKCLFDPSLWPLSVTFQLGPCVPL